MCNQEREDVKHALIDCHWTRPVWLALGLIIATNEDSGLPFRDWLERMIEATQLQGGSVERGMIILAQTAWGIWKEMKNFHFQSRNLDPVATVMKINFSLEERLADDEPPRQTHASKPAPPRHHKFQIMWHKPPPNTVKINVEAAYDQDSGRGSIAIVLSDDKGSLLLTHTRRVLANSPLFAEALAAREGLMVAQNLGLERIFIVSDCHLLVTLVREDRSIWMIDAILKDIQRFRSLFRVSGFLWVARQGNQHAHDAAKSAFTRLWVHAARGSPSIFSSQAIGQHHPINPGL